MLVPIRELLPVTSNNILLLLADEDENQRTGLKPVIFVVKHTDIIFCEAYLNPNNPLSRHSGAGRNPLVKKTCREADKTMMLSHLRGNFLIIWIPAFAGMTGFF
ncbi:MAG: hypothetical protein Q8O24_06710 [Gallionellaceae bacterium]|nr:hypothetical protein [Gallionellaceae bacterium]